MKTAFSPKRFQVFITLLACWSVSLFIALFPLSSQLQHIFVNEVTFDDNPFTRDAHSDIHTTRHLVDGLIVYDLKEVFSKNGSYFEFMLHVDVVLECILILKGLILNLLIGKTWKNLEQLISIIPRSSK